MANIFGTLGADLRVGTFGDDRVSGGPAGADERTDTGDDTLNAGTGGEDTIFGWGGDDSIVAAAGSDFNYDSLLGGSGNDTIEAFRAEAYGGAGDDLVIGTGDQLYAVGGAGRDTLFGHDESDTLLDDDVANTDADLLSGGGGFNGFFSYGGADTLDGSGGSADFGLLYRTALTVGFRFTPTSVSDVYVASDGTYVVGIERFVRVEGGSGDDTISGLNIGSIVTSGYDEQLYGNGGNDSLTGGFKDAAFGGDGNDTISMMLGEAYGGADADRIVGSGRLFGEDGDDTLIATGPNGNFATQLLGGAGADSLIGSDSADYLSDDGLFIGAGSDSDTLSGGRGRDTLASYGGADLIDGGNGNDTAVIDRSTVSDALRFRTPDAVTAKNFADGTRVRNVENFNITTATGADRLFGNAGDDRLFAGAGNDLLNGGAGDDNLEGGDGDDTLIGGDGGDGLAGGFGADVYRWDSLDGVSDFVFGFDAADRLRFSVAAVGGLLPIGRIGPGNLAFDAPTSAAPQFVIVPSPGGTPFQLFWDADGTGSGAAVAIATFSFGSGVPSASDFVIFA